MKHKILIAILCIAFLILLIPPVNTPAAQAAESIHLGLIYPLNQPDPLFVENSSEAVLAEQQFLGLVRLDENGNLIPDLAQGWEISDDGLTWTFFLQEGVPWVASNFERIRDVYAEDVLFTMFRAFEFGLFEEIVQGIEPIDDYTIQFSLRAPNPEFGTLLAVSPAAKIVPFDLVQEAGDAWIEPGVIWGAGSYLMVERTDSFVRLEANPFYKDETGVVVRSILVEYTPNYEEALQRYLRGEFDIIELPPEFGEIMSQEPGLGEQVRFPEAVSLSDWMIGSGLLQIEPKIPHSYLVKPYLLPAFSGHFGLARFIDWGFDTQPPEVQIPGTTRVLNEESLRSLKSITEDQSVLVFERMTPQLSLIFVDNIIVGDSSLAVGNDAAPFGFLRRVANIYTESSGELVIETVPAALEEAIQNGGQSQLIPVDLERIFQEAPLENSTLHTGDGTSLVGYAPTYAGLNVTIDHVIFDEDGDTSTTNDQVKARGWVNVQPGVEVNLDFDIKNHRLQYFNFFTVSKESVRVELSSKVDVLSFDKRVTIAGYTFMPVTFFVGYVPVVITPQLTLSVGANGKVSVELSTGLDQSAKIITGAKYENGDWRLIAEISESHIGKIETELKQSAKVEAFAGPELSVKVYGAAGPYGRIKGYLTLSADPTDNPWWTLKGGVNGDLGIRVDLFSFAVASYSIPITILPEQVLDQAGGGIIPPTDIPAVSQTPTVKSNGSDDDSDDSCSTIWWPPNCWPWWLWVIVVVVVLVLLRLIF